MNKIRKGEFNKVKKEEIELLDEELLINFNIRHLTLKGMQEMIKEKTEDIMENIYRFYPNSLTEKEKEDIQDRLLKKRNDTFKRSKELLKEYEKIYGELPSRYFRVEEERGETIAVLIEPNSETKSGTRHKFKNKQRLFEKLKDMTEKDRRGLHPKGFESLIDNTRVMMRLGEKR